MKSTCKTCRHWDDLHVQLRKNMQSGEMEQFGRCAMVYRSERVAFTEIHSRHDFGCIEWEARK